MLDLAARMLKNGYLIASMTLFERPPIRQAAALCYRLNGDDCELLLITSRRSGKWGVPKGSIEGEETSHAAAAREALEEAGIEGRVCPDVVGEFRYSKEGSGRRYDVTVHLLETVSERQEFEERGQRQMRWIPVDEAAELVADPGLKALIRQCRWPDKSS